MARRWGDFSSSLSRKLSHSTFEKRPDRRCAWGEGEGSSCPGSARCAKPRRRTPARSRGRTITSSRSGRRGAYASWCALPQRVVAFSSPQILRSAEPLDHAFAARIADLTPFPRPQTPQNPADIDGPAGCVSLVDDARAKPAATTGQDDAEDEDEDDAGVPFPPLPTPRRSTALLSTRAVLHPNHRPEVVARDIAWSPLGLAPASSDESSGDDVLGGGGCLLAVASGSRHVTVHAPPNLAVQRGVAQGVGHLGDVRVRRGKSRVARARWRRRARPSREVRVERVERSLRRSEVARVARDAAHAREGGTGLAACLRRRRPTVRGPEEPPSRARRSPRRKASRRAQRRRRTFRLTLCEWARRLRFARRRPTPPRVGPPVDGARVWSSPSSPRSTSASGYGSASPPAGSAGISG